MSRPRDDLFILALALIITSVVAIAFSPALREAPVSRPALSGVGVETNRELRGAPDLDQPLTGQTRGLVPTPITPNTSGASPSFADLPRPRRNAVAATPVPKPSLRPSATSRTVQRIRPSVAPQTPRPIVRSTPDPKYGIPWLTANGTATTYGAGWSEWWVALPHGPGWRFRVCGPGGCRTLVSHDAGPDLAAQRKGRIVDLPVGAFEDVCGVSWRMGACQVSVTLLGRA